MRSSGSLSSIGRTLLVFVSWAYDTPPHPRRGGAAGAGRALAAGGAPHGLRREHGRHPGVEDLPALLHTSSA